MDLNRVRNQPSAAEILSHIDEDSLSRILKVSFAWSEQKTIIIILDLLAGVRRREAG